MNEANTKNTPVENVINIGIHNIFLLTHVPTTTLKPTKNEPIEKGIISIPHPILGLDVGG